MTHILSVGQLYHPGRTRWPEAVQYQLRGGTHELVMFWPGLAVRDIAAVRRGPCEFALLVQQPVIWLLYRFDGACDWSDAPFSVHLVPEAERGPAMAVDTLGATTRALLHVVLVDAGSGVVRALRQVSLSPEFTAALHAGINEQLAAPWDERAYDAALQRGYEAWPTAEAMLAAALARCPGGA
ncbi:hypothetical protein WMF30_10615 [Sorangium sp. So ce134]